MYNINNVRKNLWTMPTFEWPHHLDDPVHTMSTKYQGIRTKAGQYTKFMFEQHPHLCDQAGFWDIAIKSGNNRDRAKFQDCPQHSWMVGKYALMSCALTATYLLAHSIYFPVAMLSCLTVHHAYLYIKLALLKHLQDFFFQ